MNTIKSWLSDLETSFIVYLLPLQVQQDPLRGALFENLVINEIIKKFYNPGLDADVFFYRDKHGNEVDVLLPLAQNIIPIEIKSSETYHNEFLRGLQYFNKVNPLKIQQSILMYGEWEELKSEEISIINCKKIYREIALEKERRSRLSPGPSIYRSHL